MRRLYTILLLLLPLATLSARKPADTLSARHWEFVQNLGQWDAQVRFAAKTNSGSLFFDNNGLTVTQLHPQQLQAFHEAKHSGKPISNTILDAAAYRITFVNANLFKDAMEAFTDEIEAYEGDKMEYYKNLIQCKI